MSQKASLGAILVFAAIGAVAAARDLTRSEQVVDRSQPPAVQPSEGGFTVRRLPGPVEVDGRAWIAVAPIIEARTVSAPNRQFAIRLEEATSVDIVFFRIWFSEDGRAPVQVNPGSAAYAYITPDSRWVISGTLEAIDVRNWRAYSLSKAFNIRAFVVLEAISADTRKLFIRRQACPFDCQGIPDEYFEIGIPAG